MKRLALLICLLVCSFNAFSQNDVTTFLGIPVDGSKAEMIRKLKTKGFVETIVNDVLEGEFNGQQVYVNVVTNKNKVYRVALNDINTIDEASIKIRFNTLCYQFMNNSKYINIGDLDYSIPYDEDISYEMSVNSKRYEAVFYQQPLDLDTTAIKNEIMSILSTKYSEEELISPTKDMQDELIDLLFSYTFNLISKKSVWFMISERNGEYAITMYYDNEYNAAMGEDL